MIGQIPLSELETRLSPKDKVTGPISPVGVCVRASCNLRSASTTMKITRSKGGARASDPFLAWPNVALPGMNGLYGKNPVAKMRIEMGIKILPRINGIATRRDIIVQPASTVH